MPNFILFLALFFSKQCFSLIFRPSVYKNGYNSLNFFCFFFFFFFLPHLHPDQTRSFSSFRYAVLNTTIKCAYIISFNSPEVGVLQCNTFSWVVARKQKWVKNLAPLEITPRSTTPECMGRMILADSMEKVKYFQDKKTLLNLNSFKKSGVSFKVIHHTR